MPAPEIEITQLRQQLSQSYQKLSTLRRQIVRLFSVIYEPVNRSTFLKCLDSIGEKQENGKAFNSKTLKSHLEYLLEQNLLIQERGKSPQCHPLMAEIATRDAIKAGVWSKMVKVVETCIPISTYYSLPDSRNFSSREQLLREVRIGIYRQDMKFILRQLECYQKYGYSREPILLDEILELLLNNPFDSYWFNRLPQELYELGLAGILVDSVMNLTDVEEQFTLLQAEANKLNGRCSDNLRLLLTEQFILRDDIESAKHYLQKISEKIPRTSQCFLGMVSLFRGRLPTGDRSLH